MSTAIQYDIQVHDRMRDAFMEQIVNAVNGYFKVYTICLGSRLGLYTASAHERRYRLPSHHAEVLRTVRVFTTWWPPWPRRPSACPALWKKLRTIFSGFTA
jgi:hypothetical protein